MNRARKPSGEGSEHGEGREQASGGSAVMGVGCGESEQEKERWQGGEAGEIGEGVACLRSQRPLVRHQQHMQSAPFQAARIAAGSRPLLRPTSTCFCLGNIHAQSEEGKEEL